MPTGYTHPVADGEIADLRTFTLRCARAFGALAHLRDERLDAPIPTVVEPDTRYYDDRLVMLRKRAEDLAVMTEDDARKQVVAERVEAARTTVERSADTEARIDRMRAMLAKVDAWTPPTQAHAELKKFMASQLRESIDWEAPVSVTYHTEDAPTPAAWLAERRKQTQEAIEHCESSRADEICRAAEKTRWLQELAASLA